MKNNLGSFPGYRAAAGQHVHIQNYANQLTTSVATIVYDFKFEVDALVSSSLAILTNIGYA